MRPFFVFHTCYVEMDAYISFVYGLHFLPFLSNIYAVSHFLSLQDGHDAENSKQSTADMTVFVSTICYMRFS